MLEKQQASVWGHVHTLHYIKVASLQSHSFAKTSLRHTTEDHVS